MARSNCGSAIAVLLDRRSDRNLIRLLSRSSIGWEHSINWYCVMRDRDPFENLDIQRLRLFLYLVPVIGFFPALWTLYYRHGNRQAQDLSRSVVILTLGWIVGYVMLGLGSEVSESYAVALLLSSSVLTSGYFLTNLWLMMRLWQRKSLRLPLISHLGDRLP